MLTYTYISKGKFGLVEKPKPTIQHERDAENVFANLSFTIQSPKGWCFSNSTLQIIFKPRLVKVLYHISMIFSTDW